MLIGMVFTLVGKTGGFASVINAFVGFGMSLFNFFMNSKESVKGTKFSIILYAIIAIAGIASFVFYHNPFAGGNDGEATEEIPQKAFPQEDGERPCLQTAYSNPLRTARTF